MKYEMTLIVYILKGRVTHLNFPTVLTTSAHIALAKSDIGS